MNKNVDDYISKVFGAMDKALEIGRQEHEDRISNLDASLNKLKDTTTIRVNLSGKRFKTAIQLTKSADQ